jgi:phosphoglycerol transferase
MSFANGTYPSYVVGVAGLSKPEGWGTWTEGRKVEFRFARPLPSSFDLTLKVGSAFGANKGAPIKVRAGTKELTFAVDREPIEVTLAFREVGKTSALSFEIPKPESPQERGMGEDPRKLGIAFVTMAVTPK